MQRKPDWGRGRIDPFNPVSDTVRKQPVDDTIGNSDMVPLWNLKQHRGYSLQWDGLNANLQEVVLSSAIGDGATTKWVDRDFQKWNNTRPGEMSSLRRVQNYISNVQPPAYPFAIDRALAASGEAVYRGQCASCHAIGGARTGTVIPVSEVGTDDHRLGMWTPASASASTAGDGHPGSSGFKDERHVSVPLEGLWLRAPYLHNGSVPSLADLLENTHSRPNLFWRGYDVYDATKVGFVSTGPDAEHAGTKFDVSLAGNSNAGHLYGTDLPAEAKQALLEYLKTL
jgi:mono/diheme cytochrome c family protein